MALMTCGGCGRDVSSQAVACPNCGHPTQGSRSGAPGPTITIGKNSHSVRTFLGGLVAMVLVVGLIDALVNQNNEGQAVETAEAAKSAPPPLARFVVTDVLMDENCTQIGDYCVSVHCTYQNVGDAAGATRIHADLLGTSGGAVAARESNLTLMPGSSQRVTFNFDEAVLERQYRSECRVE